MELVIDFPKSHPVGWELPEHRVRLTSLHQDVKRPSERSSQFSCRLLHPGFRFVALLWRLSFNPSPFQRFDGKETGFTHSPRWESTLWASCVACGAPPRNKAVNKPSTQSAHNSASNESSPHSSLVGPPAPLRSRSFFSVSPVSITIRPRRFLFCSPRPVSALPRYCETKSSTFLYNQADLLALFENTRIELSSEISQLDIALVVSYTLTEVSWTPFKLLPLHQTRLSESL